MRGQQIVLSEQQSKRLEIVFFLSFFFWKVRVQRGTREISLNTEDLLWER